MNNMFDNCISLLSIPDISNWNTNNVQDMNHMFDNCRVNLNIPNKFIKK